MVVSSNNVDKDFITNFEHLRCIKKDVVDAMIREFNISDKPVIKNLVLSMTTYPKRIDDVHYAIFSILNQSILPEKFILWLTRDEFPLLEQGLPESILQFKRFGLEIRFTDAMRSFQKIIPTLRDFPNSVIVTADDDIFYPCDWLKSLYDSYLDAPSKIYAHRMHRVEIINDKIASYAYWSKCIVSKVPTPLNFATAVGGVLYPPNVFEKEVLNKSSFLKLCPMADDVWIWAMAVFSGVQIVSPMNTLQGELIFINPERELGYTEDKTLSMLNVMGGCNDRQIDAVVNHYNLLEKILG